MMFKRRTWRSRSADSSAALVVGGARRTAGVARGALMAVGLLVGWVTMGSALTITGGPVYTLPGGGSCTVSGTTTLAGGATVSCTGVNLGAHSNVYFGIKNNTIVNGNTMTGSAATAGSAAVFTWLSNTASSITYESTTSVNDFMLGSQPVTNRLTLTLTSGSATVVPTGGIPANNTRGDIERLFRITSGSSFSIRVDVDATSPSFGLPFDNACPKVFNPTKTTINGGDISRVDLGFYYSDCGDGVQDSPEQCDLGALLNGNPGTCCTSTCTFRTAGEVCRVGAGPPCDTNETCTGAGSSCPPDDAFINAGSVCRTGSGDVCDQNETCTGVPGQGCPIDDAPGNAGLTCRVSTVGDICDQDEVCTGAPGAPCPPDDAPGKLNLPCRPGSGDICDPTELCTGVPGQGCPADVVANPTTVCRAGSGDSCDPTEFCTAIPTQPCPADVVQPGGTVCRAAVGDCDVAEQCSGTPGVACPANGFAAVATSCNSDADVCTVDECDGGGNCLFVEDLDCSDGSGCTQDSCDPIDGCQYDGAPSPNCTSPVKAVFKVKDKDNDKGDKVIFVWKGGPALIGDMGDPTQGTEYELCVYDNNGVQMAMTVPPGAGWTTLGSPADPKGFKFKDKNAANDGIKLILTKGSNLDKGKAKVVGKAEGLPDTGTLPFQFPVTAQLYASGGMCWEAQFDSAATKRNEDDKFIGKVPAN
jgi:hypothetical protein